MKFWSAALLATGAVASAVLDPPLVPADNKVNLFAEHSASSYHHSDHHYGGETNIADSSAPRAPYRIPTSRESAVLARRILALTPLGTISTVFPRDGAAVHAWENRPAGLGGIPVGLPEYVAACEEDDSASGHGGNPTLLAIRIATTFKNARAGSNVSLALQWEPPHPPTERVSLLGSVQHFFRGGKRPSVETAPFSAAALPRFSLFGYLEPISGQDEHDSPVASCFVRTHPDARYWLPGNSIHQSAWARLVVTQVYWIGGFGDRAYIGWIPIEQWRNVTRAEWEKARLPGEQKGWREWSAGAEL